MKIKIAIAEDDPNLMGSVIEKIKLFDGIDVIWVAENGQVVLDKITNQRPDLILMDINMPVMNGIDATRKVRNEYPGVKVIMLTVFDESDKIFDSILAGANGYLLKDEKPSKLFEAIEEALDDGAPMSPAIANKALRLIRGGTKHVQQNVDFGLTAREIEILDYIAAGKSYTVIAEALFISPKTVRKHIENIYKKLQVHNKVEAIQLAQRHGML